MTNVGKVSITAAHATILVAIASLVSAVLVAFVTGSFSKGTSEIERLKEQAVESIRQEGSTRIEEIRQLTAKVVEETKSEGSIKIEKFKLQRDLILDAIKTKDRQEAQKRLKFFALTGLIPDYENKVLKFTSSESINEIPILPPDRITRLKPLGSLYGEKAGSIVRLLNNRDNRQSYTCAGFVIANNKLITPHHCVSAFKAVSEIFISFADKTGKQQSTKVTKISKVESKGGQKFSQDLAIIETLSSNLVPMKNLTIRKPEIGENVLIIGVALAEEVGFRGARPISLTESFLADSCLVTEVNESEGYVGTNCTTGRGTSGSPIFSQDDGALLSLVAWGRNEEETNGPLLYELQQVLELLALR